MKKINIYISLEKMTASLISSLLQNHSFHIHSISSRTKTIDSFKEKISRPDKNYDQLKDITDIVGIRITTYFSDELDKVSELIKSQFKVDLENSIDKRKSLEPDKFGYMSLHLVAEHNNIRTNLPEYSLFADMKFEVQIRSILQHAWAEIEHDLGYKSEIEIPNIVKRKFSRLSGLLELVDDEFVSIKNIISEYIKVLPNKLSEKPAEITIDIDSLKAFILNTQDVIRIENQMRDVFDCPIFEPRSDTLSMNLDRLKILNIETIEQLSGIYESHKEDIVPFLNIWLDKENKWNRIHKGVSILYVIYLYLIEKNDPELSRKVLYNFRQKDGKDIVTRLHEVGDIYLSTKLQ
ncbi:GTP pyrophosphokinase family protein [Aeromonas caviae]